MDLFTTLNPKSDRRFRGVLPYIASFFCIIVSCITGYSQSCVFTCPEPAPPMGISLSANCQDTLSLELLDVDTTAGCSSSILIQVMDGAGNDLGDVITGDMIGNTYMVLVTDQITNQACMFPIQVLDKQDPVFQCPSDTLVPCATSLDSIPGLTASDVSDCSPVSVTSFDVLISTNQCNTDTFAHFERHFIVSDTFGNVATCVQDLYFAQEDITNVAFPQNLTGADALSCFPAPDTTPFETGFPMLNGMPLLPGTACNLSVTYSDTEIFLCSGSKKIHRTWTVTDLCNNHMTIDSIQRIEILDTTPPVIDLPDTFTVAAGPGCMAAPDLPVATITDDCSSVWTVRMSGPFGTIQRNGGPVGPLSAGTYHIEYAATNDCLYEGKDTLVLVITDLSPPSPFCKSAVTIPVQNDGMVVVQAGAFDGGSSDNCSPIYFKAKRMAPPVGYDCFDGLNSGYMFDDKIKFCCDDIDNAPIMVILRVYDREPDAGVVSDDHLLGHFNDCMLEVEIQDKLPPVMVCPTDLTVSCQFDFDPDNLEVFGKVVTDPGLRDDICLDDIGNPANSGLTCIGQDGLATDNCSVIVQETESVIMDTLCQTGSITRTFTATDAGGLQTHCQQRITIQNFLPFTMQDISPPPDTTIRDLCSLEDLDPEDLLPPHDRPVLDQDECDLVSAVHNDIVFDFSLGNEACFKILRTWTVIDWCQYDQDIQSSEGIWEFTQVIKVINTVGPEILSGTRDTILCTDDPACGPGEYVLEATANDDCSGTALRWNISIDLGNDGSFDESIGDREGNTVSIPYTFPLGDHRILYSVEDFCGNITTEEQMLTMRSCKPPSAKCIEIITSLMPVDADGDGVPDGGMINISAPQLDAGSEHICGNPVTVAFSADPTDQIRTYTCDSIGVRTVNMWVIDDNGNTDFCTTTITIQDNGNVCPQTGTLQWGTVTGAVRSVEHAEVEDVNVFLHGSGLPSVNTDQAGAFAFPPMPHGGAYTIEPVLDENDKNGVSTIDLLQIQKHLLGHDLIDSPYDLIAADANASGSVTAVDILELRKLILGVYETLPGNKSWRFVDAAYNFADPANPFTEPFPETYQIAFLDSDMELEFVGIKIGDINHSASTSQLDQSILVDRSSEGLMIYPVLQKTQQEGMYVIDFFAENLESFQTAQFTLNLDEGLFEVISLMPGIFRAEALHYDSASENIMVSWFTTLTQEAFTGPVFSIRVNAGQTPAGTMGMQIKGDPTPIESLHRNGSPGDVRLIERAPEITNQTRELLLGQNYPNPFAQLTHIPFMLTRDGSVRIMIHDIYGQLVFSQEMDLPAGKHDYPVSAEILGATGCYFYTVESNSTRMTRRMIIAN